MDSNEIEIEQKTTLKHLWLLEKIVVRILVVLSNAYDFAKENSGDFKTTVVSIENVVVFTFGPLYEKLKDSVEQTTVFVDNEFEKYAPSLAKNLVAEFQSLIYKNKPLAKQLLTPIQTAITPPITTTIFLLQTTNYFIQNITTTTTATTKSATLDSKAQSPLEKGHVTTRTPLQSTPPDDTMKSILQHSLDAAKSLAPDANIQTGTDLADKAQDTSKSLLGGIPLVGNVAESIVSKPTDLANQIANATDSLVNENPVLEAVNSAAESSLDAAKSLAPDIILQTGTDLANQAQDATKSLAGGIPFVGNATQALVTNPTDLANQIANTTSSLVNENPVQEAVNSAAESSLDAARSLAPNTILQTGADLAKQAQDTTESQAGGIPLVGDAAQSLVTNTANLADQVVNTANSLVNENPVLEAVDSAAQNIGKKPQATGTKAALQSAYMTIKLAMIPVIAQLWYEIVNKYPTIADLSEFILPVVECMCKLYNKVVTYMDGKGCSVFGYLPLVPVDEMKAAYKLVKTTSDGLSAVGNLLGPDKNKGLSAVGDLLGMNKNNTNKTGDPGTILQKGSEVANQAQDTTKSLVGSVPLVGNAAQSLMTKQTELANQALNTANSLVNENPLLEAANSAAQNIGKKPQATGTKAALQSAYMTLRLAMVPVIAQLWYEVVNKYPLVAELSEFILPMVECMCKLYNKVVTYMDEKGCSVFGYLPLIPVDEIEAAYKLVKTSSDALSAVGDLLGTHNNEGLSAVGDLLGMNKNN